MTPRPLVVLAAAALAFTAPAAAQDNPNFIRPALEIEARRHGLYHASPDELKAIDEALAAVARGEIASDEEVEAVFAKYRRP